MRKLYLSLLVLVVSSSAFAQGTILPDPIFTGLDASGNPLVSGKLCTYVAGSSTPATTYTTSALNVANTNPVILNSAGRATVFLRPGSSYKFVLYSAGSDQTCSTGTLQWSTDNISALPSSNVNLDIDGTAGESLAAGDVVYLKDSTGWYKADADAAASSSEAAFLGMVPTAIASGATGTIRIKGLVTVTGPLTTATTYYVSSVAGAVTATPPTLVRNVGVGYTSTSMLLSPANNGKLPGLTFANLYNANPIADAAQGRCTLTSGTAVTTTDVTAATTVYYALYSGNTIGLYTGATWIAYPFTQLSVAVPSTTTTPFDVFVDYNDGTPVLSTTNWTNDTTRATALTTQDGKLVKTGDTQQRYVCTGRTTGVSGQTEDSFAKRFLWNYYNRVPRPMRATDSTDTWNYTTATWRQARATATNQLEFVIGVAEVPLESEVTGYAFNSGGSAAMAVSIGVDSTSAPTTGNLGMYFSAVSNGVCEVGIARLRTFPAVGYHYAAWLEYSVTTTGTTAWCGDNGTPTILQAGISGVILG